MSKKRQMVSFLEGNGSPIKVQTLNRNQKCVCGSGKKQKNFCGVETKYFKTNLKNQTND